MKGNATLHLMLDELIEAVAERVAKKLGRPSEVTVVYTTHKSGPNIPGKTREWMLRRIKTMPGSRRVGRDWTIRATDYETWAAAQDCSRVRSRAPSLPMSMDDIAYADAMLAKAGLRIPDGVK
jgi:hypothetical protein